MGFLNSVSGFFKRDKNTQIAKQAKGISVADPNVRFGNGIVTGSDGNSMGMMGLSAALNMDQDLMMRYSDYEGMDEYPELQNGLDIFADDCTVTDNIRGKTIWAESKDKVIRDIVDDLLHRRLRIEEDIWSTVRSLGKYGNCLPTGTRVWTEHGIVPIEDIKIGMRVLGYKDGRRELFSVIDTFDNGEKEIFKISTKHRELYATAEHPILVNRNGKMEWVRVRDLRLERWPNGNINQSKTDKIVMATKAYDNNTHETAKLTFSMYRYEDDFACENVLDISPAGNAHVYDIEVDDDAHNFIAEGVVVHNCFAELIMLPGQGVVGLNPLPVATMRRIIDMRGSTLGYMQDMTGQFSFSMGNVKNIKELKQALRERQIIFFEPWEIVHWRLSSKHIRSIYGISVIDAARWIFKRLVMLEDTMLLYRLSRSPGRYAFYVDTGDLPPSEAMAQVKKVKQSYKKRTLLNPSTGQLEFRNNPMCLSGYTVVKLEDGRRLSILEIVEEFEAGKVNAVYSYDMGSKKRKVMPITWAGKTRDHAAMVKVTLQNGNSIYCTPDHEFPLFDGGKCKAQDLNGKRLVSLNLDPEMVFDVCEWGPAEKTYTLTINGTHTFGLDAGVFTCNSPEEDIFIPTRGGKESTRVEILSGPDWSVNDDLEYLRDKLFTSIKIPRAYYGGDADASQSLAQKDVRFARTCLRIQREFRNGIRHIARVHMASLSTASTWV